MSLLSYYQRYMAEDKDVYILADSTSSWGTTEKEYAGTKNRTINGYIQPKSGNTIFKNQQVTQDTTHVLYVYNDVVLNDTDKIVFNGSEYQITYNQKLGVSGISDHKEIGLKVL